ncbi:serine/threonine-protein kinase [Streptomyces boninensis]|uniref:serine/threonine-protein kinase n=1 Tax=Streptomyces boninensis TaxID=2039455 RepID=UPI003B210611
MSSAETGAGGEDRVVAGRYRLISALGRGGMGVVWQARDEVLGREVAVKEVRAPVAFEDSEVQRLYARLEREAWAAARISHRNVVTVYDVATDEGRPWIVMELIKGLSFADILDSEGPITPARAAKVGAEVLAALRAAHEAGVLHRDVKPGNILVANDGRVVLTDFGIAVVEGGSAITMTGELIGSPEFLAPERALGRNPGPASDLWSLGVTMYAAVQGNSPFRQDTPLSTLRAVVDEELPPATRAGPLGPVIQALLQKDPAQRLGPDAAEGQLRLIAAGGTPRTPTEVVTTPSQPPTEHATPPPPPPGGPQPWTPAAGSAASAATGPTGFGSTTTTTDVSKRRRAGAVFAAGLLALAIAGGGIAYALLGNDDDPKDTGGSSGGDSAGSGGGDTAGKGKGDDKQADASGGNGESGQDGGTTASGSPGDDSPSPTKTHHQPPQSVKVSVSGSRTTYKGACPLPASAAPYFTGTITVTRLPATVTYRWVNQDGSGIGAYWKTLSFPAGGGKSKSVNHTETVFVPDGTRKGWVGLEVSKPKAASGNHVPFTITCEKEPSPSGSYTINSAP